MNQDKFKLVYDEFRNGTDFTRHPLARKLIYSDGVKELAELGLYWLLDIVGTECVQAMKHTTDLGQLTVEVALQGVGNAAFMSLNLADNAPNIWTREIDYTDMPIGRWVFFLKNDGDGDFKLILPSEY